MRRKLIAILRELEKETALKNEYTEFLDQYQCHYSVEEYIDFPNYKLVTHRLNDRYPVETDKGFILPTSDASVRAELKRMEADGLVMIGVQEGQKSATTESNQGPDFDELFSFTCESIVLTTKGKSEWRYIVHEITRDPLSVIAIVVSAVSLIISILK